MAARIDTGFVRRGTVEYEEFTRILGSRANSVLDEGVRQINGRYFKAICIVRDSNGVPQLADDNKLATKSRRMRIPRDSFLRRRRF